MAEEFVLSEKEKELQRELDEFKNEKERVRKMLGQIGGKTTAKREYIINLVFLIFIIAFFLLEMVTHFLPAAVSLEISVLLVSLKIVWMIHSQHKVNHFQFWILNSIEFKINDVSKKLRKLEKELATIKEGN